MSLYNSNLICKGIDQNEIVFYNADIKKLAPNEIGVIKGKGKGKGKKKKEEEVVDLDDKHSSSEEEEDEEGLDEYEEEESEVEVEEGVEDQSQKQSGDVPTLDKNSTLPTVHVHHDNPPSSDDIMDSFIDEEDSQPVKHGKEEKSEGEDEGESEDDDEPPVLIKRKKKKVEEPHHDDILPIQDDTPGHPVPTSSDKFLKKMLKSKSRSKSSSGGRIKDKVIASGKEKEKLKEVKTNPNRKGNINNNNNNNDNDDNNNPYYHLPLEGESPFSTPPPPLSPLSPSVKENENQNGNETGECFLVNVRFPLNINPGYVKMMSCPLFTWNCDFRKEKNGYIMLRVNNASIYKDKETFDYSTLCRVANSNYSNKNYCKSFKLHLKKLGISMKTEVSSSSNSLIQPFFFPLIRMTTVPVLEMRLYFDACRYIFMSYEDYVPNSKLLLRLEEETRVEEKDNVLQFWNVLKKGKPEDRFRNSNPTLSKAWDIYHKLTDGVMAKEKVIIPFDKGVHDILVQDTDKFHVEKNFYSDKLEVSLKSVNNRVVEFASILKDINLEVSIIRVEDDHHDELFEEYEAVQFMEEHTYFLVTDVNRGHYISQEHDVVSDFIKFDIKKIPNDCRVLIIDRIHLFPFTKVMEAITQVKYTLKKLRIYGSFFSPYYQKEGYNLVEVFAWKQKERKQNNNVTYTSMCSTIGTGEKKLSFYTDLNNLKKDAKADSKYQYTAFYSNAKVRDEFNLRQVFVNIHETTVFNWFEGNDMKTKTYGKVIIVMKAMDIKKLAIVFNNIKNCEVKVYGSEEEFFEMLSSVPKTEPRYSGFVNYL